MVYIYVVCVLSVFFYNFLEIISWWLQRTLTSWSFHSLQLQKKKYRLKTRGEVSDANCCLCGGVLFAAALFFSQTDLHAPSLKRRSFSSSLGFSWKAGRWSASPGCPQTCGSYPFPLVQSSRGPGPSGRWSETISFLCSRDRKQCCSQLHSVLASTLLCISGFFFLWELNTLPLQLDWIVGND